MAALSMLMYAQVIHPAQFGASHTYDLHFPGNQPLQQEVARWFATQETGPTYAETQRQMDAKITPAQVLDTLINGTNSKSDTYTLTIFKPGYKNGHAITPYAVLDEGNNIYHVLVYDNNYPGLERVVEIDRTANTWRYASSTNPDVPESAYTGDASTVTLMLTPNSLRVKPQVCDFCSTADSSATNATATPDQAMPGFNQVILTTSAANSLLNLLIKDDQGHRLGYQ